MDAGNRTQVPMIAPYQLSYLPGLYLALYTKMCFPYGLGNPGGKKSWQTMHSQLGTDLIGLTSLQKQVTAWLAHRILRQKS